MKTAEEIARDIIIPTAGIAIAWDKAGLSSKDALRQLCEAIEREVIGDDDSPLKTNSELKNARPFYRNKLRTEQRAKLRAFCGVGEQPSAVDAEWIDQQIERSEES